jgi:hypothetical protein
VNLPREQWQVDAQARDLGQARELGAYRRSCRAARGSRRTGWGIFLIGLGLLPGLAFAGPPTRRHGWLCSAPPASWSLSALH